MASYNAGGSRSSGRRSRGKKRSGRGRSEFTDQEISATPPKYPMRNTPSRVSGFGDFFEDPNPIHETGEYSRKKGTKPTRMSSSEDFFEDQNPIQETGEYSRKKGTKPTPKGSPRIVNKNTHVVYFWRIESPYSQFHSASFFVNDTKYSCAEQFMMSSKARIFNDPKSLTSIMNTKIPAVMKRFGRGVQNFDQDIWKMCCRQFVQEGNIAKFSQNAVLLEELLSTEDRYLAEASPMDKIWGIGMAESNPQANNPSNWRGTNWLGEALNLVKFEFQTMICFILNKDRIKEVPTEKLLDLFKVGTCDYFDKMKCEILITDDRVPSYTLAKKKSSKSSQRRKRNPKTEEVEEHLAPNFDVQPPGRDGSQASEKDHESDNEKSSLGEKLKSSEGTEFPENSSQERTDEKRSPLLKRKTSPNVEEAQSSKEKPKIKKITFDSGTGNPVIPASIQTAVEYILTDWVRLKLLEDVPLLSCFMDLEPGDMKVLTGTCTYQTEFEVVNTGITISYILTNLKKEFNRLQHIFAGQTIFIKELNCAANPPVFPTNRPLARGRSNIFTRFNKKSKSTPQKVPSSEKLDKSDNEATETLNEPDSTPAEYTEISPSVQEDTKVITPDKPIEVDDSITPIETTPMDQGESPVEKHDTNKPDELAMKDESSPKEPDESPAEITAALPVESEIMEINESNTEDTDVVSKKETKEMDVTPTSSLDDTHGGKERKRKSKKKKKSTEDDQDTDSAKRHKNNSETPAKLVSYTSSSISDQDSPKVSGENQNPSNREKPHSGNEPSPAMNSANKSEITLEAITLDQKSKDVKETPVDTDEAKETS